MAKKVRQRRKYGLAAMPFDNFEKALFYMHYEIPDKDRLPIVSAFVKQNFSKEESKLILACSNYHLTNSAYITTGIHWTNNGHQLPNKWSNLLDRAKEEFAKLIPIGKEVIESKLAESNEPTAPVISPAERLRMKVESTILADIDMMVDSWMDGKFTSINLYERMKTVGLTSKAVGMIKPTIDELQAEFEGAYNKTDDQLVEGYEHISRPQLKKCLGIIESLQADLQSMKAASSATRAPRAKKPRAADKQVAKVKYQKESIDYKLVSINPVTVVGATRLYTFNTKTRQFSEYYCSSPNGFEISGTSIKNFDKEVSRQTRLRKPVDFLPKILNNTLNQNNKEIESLTTKMSTPNGRLNDDTILLRIMQK